MKYNSRVQYEFDVLKILVLLTRVTTPSHFPVIVQFFSHRHHSVNMNTHMCTQAEYAYSIHPTEY